jgi:DNA-binding NarL/FixJ family response regulator
MEVSGKINVVVVDEQEVIRMGVKAALECSSRITFLAGGVAAEDAIQLAVQYQPNVILLGLNTLASQKSQGCSLATCAIIKQLVKNYRVKVLVLSRYDHKGLIRSVLEAGASGFMQKDEALSSCWSLAQAIMAVATKEEIYLSRANYEKLLQSELQAGCIPQLTERKIEIMQTIADNTQLTQVQIAGLLGIAESTLRNNLSSIFRALDTPNLNGAMIECLRLGLVRLSQ